MICANSLAWPLMKVNKQSVVFNKDLSDFANANLSGSFSHWSADDVYHNVCTIDGKGTLHGTGLIVSTTPGSSPS